MAAAGNRPFKVDLKSNGRAVLAATRENGRLIPAAAAAALVNILLAATEQAHRNGVVQGHEGEGGFWRIQPIPGSDHATTLPTAHDVRSNTARYVYTRNAKGHILSRKAERKAVPANYLFKDKIVSRSGGFDSDLSFDMEAGVREFDLDPNVVRENFLLESNLGGLQIIADGDGAILRSTSTSDGQKMATLEKRGIQNGKGRPRYILRRAIQGVNNRWSTLMRKELAKAAKLAEQAKQRASK